VTPRTDAARRVIADLEREAADWDDAAEAAADSYHHRAAAIHRRDKLRDLLRWLPAALVEVEMEAQQDEAAMTAWLAAGAGVCATAEEVAACLD
jgi:hypothetical protein